MATKTDLRDLQKIRSAKRLAEMTNEAKRIQQQIFNLQLELEDYKNLIVQEQMWAMALENEIVNG